LYATGFLSHSLAIFGRDPNTGALSQLAGTAGCIAGVPTPGCAHGYGLVFPYGVAVRPTGRVVYVSASGQDNVNVFGPAGFVTAFHRNPHTGILSERACVSETGTPKGLCQPGRGMDFMRGIVLDQNGHYLYGAALSSAGVVAFKTTGQPLAQTGN
jgi:DNA-binding beta-propeller fold protein YncE